MAQIDYTAGEPQPKSGTKEFLGVRTDTGVGTSEFAAIAGGTRETINGKVQAPMRVQVDDSGAMGGLLVKYGATTDAAIAHDADGGLLPRMRGIQSTIGKTTDTAIAPDANGALLARLRGIAINIGETASPATTSDAAGTLIGHLRGIVALLVARLFPKVSTATLANVTASATTGTLKALNTSRLGLVVVNDADKALYVKYGATASLTSYTVKIAAGGYWEMPQPIYTGVVDGIWETSPTGSARITEL